MPSSICILVVHGLEEAEGLRPLLRQLWRVLAPEGRLLLVAPNRASLWAQMERSPFGHGRPFSRSELDALAAGRAVRAGTLAARALCAALREPGADRQRHGWERFGARFFSGLGGVHIVEAAQVALCPGHAGARRG